MSIRKLFAWLLLISILAGCVQAPAEPTATPSPDIGLQQTSSAEAAQKAQATEAAQQTALALRTAEAVQTADAQATLDVQATEQAKATQHAQATATAKYQAIQSAKTQSAMKANLVKSQSTAAAKPIFALAEKLVEEGALESSAGKLIEIDDFNQDWAQINYYDWVSSGHSLERYLANTHVHWTSASKTANWPTSGCGFVFDADNQDNHFMIYLGLDGYVTLLREYHGVRKFLARNFYGKLDVPAGEADLTMAVEGDFVTFYVNDKKVVHVHDSQIHKGPFGITLVSGTNKDFGTRCEMFDIQLWELDS